MKLDFESYLMDKHVEKEGVSPEDNGSIHRFNEWLVDLDVDELIVYANLWAWEMFKEWSSINKGDV